MSYLSFNPNWALEFPLFHFRLEGMQNASLAINVDSISCVWNQTVPLQVVPCQGTSLAIASSALVTSLPNLVIDLTSFPAGYPVFQNGLANCFAVETHNKTFAAWASMGSAAAQCGFLIVLQMPLAALISSSTSMPRRIYSSHPTAYAILDPRLAQEEQAHSTSAGSLSHLLQLHCEPHRSRRHAQLGRLGPRGATRAFFSCLPALTRSRV